VPLSLRGRTRDAGGMGRGNRTPGGVGTALLCALSLAGCGDDGAQVDTSSSSTGSCEPTCREATTARMDFTSTEFFGAPFPSDARRDADGRPLVEGFPNPRAIFLVDEVLDVLREDQDGFGVSSGIFMGFSRSLDPDSLPTMNASVSSSASVFLVSVDPAARDTGLRYPVDVRFSVEPGIYGAPDLLSILPLQGAPLRPRTRYAAVVTTSVRDEEGLPIGVAPEVRLLAEGGTPAGMPEDVAAAHREALPKLGVSAAEVAAFTVFTTGDPVSGMGRAILRAGEDGFPEAPAAFTFEEEHPTFCVFASTVEMPVYQAGDPPYTEEGGAFVLDGEGRPVLQRTETARVFVTLPRAPMPPGGFPVVVFSRTGGGGDRPLIDRGVRGEPGGEALEPGSGPALEFARVGFAGISIDGPHGGIRNVSGGDEQFLVFNFQNPEALRDNVRQSALELALVPELLESAMIPVGECAGLDAPDDEAAFDTGTIAIMGHSMGAAIAPLAIAFEARYRGMVLSGAGGSFLANMVHKEKPLKVKPLAEILLGHQIEKIELGEHDPILSMLQWAGEPADNPIYGRYLVTEPLGGAPRHILMMQGIVDHYIMPPIANATSLSFGLDLGGEALDGSAPELASLTPLTALLPLVGRGAVTLPRAGNATSSDGRVATAIVTQNAEDGLEDGHEAAFQTEPPKHAYACFLADLARSTDPPRVPAPGGVDDPCE
jgi:pimeloyl-ACP methyl ester carboxylesterase